MLTHGPTILTATTSRVSMTVLVAFAIGGLPSSGIELPAAEIVRRADQLRSPGGDLSFSVRAKDYRDKMLLRENIYRVYAKGNHLSLIETKFPERLQGRKLLMRDDKLWLYLPTMKRPTRVSFQQRLTGEVSNGDIARTNFFDDYTAKLVRTETLRGKKHYRLILTAKKDDVTYRYIHLWVEKVTFKPARAHFFAISGKLLKTGEYRGLRRVFGKPQITRVVIKDALRPSKQSHLTYSHYQRENLDESFFNKEALAE